MTDRIEGFHFAAEVTRIGPRRYEYTVHVRNGHRLELDTAGIRKGHKPTLKTVIRSLEFGLQWHTKRGHRGPYVNALAAAVREAERMQTEAVNA